MALGMAFSNLIRRVESLHQSNVCPSTLPTLKESDIPPNVYGRICNTESPRTPPRMLSDSPGRKIAFLFGPDALSSVILKLNAYEALARLGFTKEYVKYKVEGVVLNFTRATQDSCFHA